MERKVNSFVCLCYVHKIMIMKFFSSACLFRFVVQIVCISVGVGQEARSITLN